jgi:CBS domain-containing protein
VDLHEVMTESVVTAPASESVRAVAALMRERNVGSVIVVDEAGLPAGFVTDRDLAVSVLADGHDPGSGVGGYASTPVVTGTPDMDVLAAVELMAEHGIRRLPVVADGALTGIVTLDDLAVRTGDLELAASITAQVTRAALPGFYFHHRGE